MGFFIRRLASPSSALLRLSIVDCRIGGKPWRGGGKTSRNSGTFYLVIVVGPHQDEEYKILYLEFCMFNLMFDFENTIANFKNRIQNCKF